MEVVPRERGGAVPAHVRQAASARAREAVARTIWTISLLKLGKCTDADIQVHNFHHSNCTVNLKLLINYVAAISYLRFPNYADGANIEKKIYLEMLLSLL